MSTKYEEQLVIEKLNKEIIQNIIDNVGAEKFIEFYTYHNQKETMAEFGIRTTKQLTKILKIFNYDFSKPKPSKFKGKTAARSHESYVLGGQKSSETQKQHWETKSDKEKEAWSLKQSLAHSSDEFKQKIKQINLDYQASLTKEQKQEIKDKKAKSNKNTWNNNKTEILNKSRQTCLAKYGVDNYTKSEEYQNKIHNTENLYRRAIKTNQTKTLNQSWNLSKPEEDYYNYLITKYGEDDVVRQYHDIRYPFNCDFYIKSLDLFIELNLTWSHGKHPYNANDPEDFRIAQIWAEKAKTSDYYKGALFVWTVKDPEKLKTALTNNLNYKVYYNEADLYE